MKIAIGSDHVGYGLKVHVAALLADAGHGISDVGTHSDLPTSYPYYCVAVARLVTIGEADRGIVIEASGQGAQITANKVPGVRAALCNDLYTTRLSRQYNDANVLSFGSQVIGVGLAEEIVGLWLATPFEGGRHQRCIDQIAEVENQAPMGPHRTRRR